MTKPTDRDCPLHGPRPHRCNGIDWPTKPEPSAPLDVGARDRQKLDPPVPTTCHFCGRKLLAREAIRGMLVEECSCEPAPASDVDRRLDEVREWHHHWWNSTVMTGSPFERAITHMRFLLALVDELRRR